MLQPSKRLRILKFKDVDKDSMAQIIQLGDQENWMAMMRFRYVYLLHSKDEALDKFKVFKTEVELQQWSLIKRFRTDMGGEYMDTLFQSVGLSQGFWGEAMLTAFYLLNRVPNKRNMITPYELLTKKKPNLNYLRRSLVNGTKDSGGSVVPKKVTDDALLQPEPELRKSKRHRILKDFGQEFQLYLTEGTRDLISDQHAYCFNVEDNPKIFNEAMKSQDVAFWKEAINDEMDSIMGNNT
ncbi:zinc finger, CCHC-type containing protein [Tanacetum coccineum]